MYSDGFSKAAEPSQVLGAANQPSIMRKHSLADSHSDPMEAMGNLFDVAILIGVGFMIVALSGFGLSDMLGKEDVTIVKNPGTDQMEIITKKDGKIERLKRTNDQAQGAGIPVGTVYRLDDGRMVWIPGNEPAGSTVPGQ